MAERLGVPGWAAGPATEQALREFWEQQKEEIEQVGTDMQEFKNHQLPLARIKKVRGRAAPTQRRQLPASRGRRGSTDT